VKYEDVDEIRRKNNNGKLKRRNWCFKIRWNLFKPNKEVMIKW